MIAHGLAAQRVSNATEQYATFVRGENDVDNGGGAFSKLNWFYN